LIALVEAERDRGSPLPVIRMCRLFGFDRTALYRSSTSFSERDMALRDAIQRIALTMPDYGYRMVTKQLHRQQWKAGTRRVRRIMREDNLLCLRRRKSWIRYPKHGLPRHPNLAADFVPGDIDQLWVADLAYVRLRFGFVYLAVIMDAFSRRAIGWALGRSLEGELTIRALCMALRSREISPGLIHHSDGGVQHAAHDYVAILREHGARPSMSRPGIPTDNASCERFIGTLKRGEIYLKDYADFDDAEASIGASERGITLHFIDPGKPVQNGKIESFHSRLRAESIHEEEDHTKLTLETPMYDALYAWCQSRAKS
jgi:transposase InsO family protein